ncbi:MAG: hypothetical protein HY791_29630 [Deltaproteobacteria bacterium]|nr:hypothetical protein [Deltaproteobacteria bacterium]
MEDKPDQAESLVRVASAVSRDDLGKLGLVEEKRARRNASREAAEGVIETRFWDLVIDERTDPSPDLGCSRSCWRRAAPIRTSDSDFRFRLPIQTSDSDFRFRPPIQTSDSDLRFRPPIQTSDSDFRFRLPIRTSDSDFRFRLPIQTSDSDLRFGPPIQTFDSDFRFRLQRPAPSESGRRARTRVGDPGGESDCAGEGVCAGRRI